MLTAVLLWDSRRRIDECRHLTISLGNAWNGRRHLPGAFHFSLLSLAQAIKLQGPILVIATAGTPFLVSVYATHRALATVAGNGMALLQGPFWPELSVLWGRQRLAELRAASVVATKITVLVTGGIALVLWFTVPTLYPLWTGRELTLDPTLFAVLLIQAVLAAGWSTSSWCLQAANRHRTIALWSVLNALVSVTGAALLIKAHGVVGVGLASLVADIVLGFLIFPRLAAAMLDVKPAVLYREIARAGGPILLLFAVAHTVITELAIWPATMVLAALVILLAYPIGCAVLGRQVMGAGLHTAKGLVTRGPARGRSPEGVAGPGGARERPGP